MTKRTIQPAPGATPSFSPGTTPTGMRATEAGTTRYAERHQDRVRDDHFRAGAGGVVLSSLGIGTYLGADTDADDEAYTDAVRTALRTGIRAQASGPHIPAQWRLVMSPARKAVPARSSV